jgi:hypothetical protein
MVSPSQHLVAGQLQEELLAVPTMPSVTKQGLFLPITSQQSGYLRASTFQAFPETQRSVLQVFMMQMVSLRLLSLLALL